MYINDRKEITKTKIEIIKNRSRLENLIRTLLLEEEYIEVKTPIINRYADIAPITQFKVQSPLEETELYLRIAPTEYLKKLIHLGFDKVFEFSTNFRNDQIDKSHLFEFTSLEIMDKNKSVYDKMDQTEYLIKKCMEYCIENDITCGNLDFLKSLDKDWVRISIIDYFFNNYNIDINDEKCIEKLSDLYSTIFNKMPISNSKSEMISKIADYIVGGYETPVFIGEFPWYMEGPAKKLKTSEGKERYELYYKNIELANMSSTLVDQEMLLKWYDDTILNKNISEGREYALDPELISIFKEGMPDSAVVGIGIDRLIMLLLNIENIKQVVCFDNDCSKNKLKKIGKDEIYGKN